jgi:hypothetical protein
MGPSHLGKLYRLQEMVNAWRRVLDSLFELSRRCTTAPTLALTAVPAQGTTRRRPNGDRWSMNKTLACTLALLFFCVAPCAFAQSSGESQPVNPFRIVIEAKPTPVAKAAREEKVAEPSIQFAAYDDTLPEPDATDEELPFKATDEEEEVEMEEEEHTTPDPSMKKQTSPGSVLTRPAPAKHKPMAKPQTSIPYETIIPEAEGYDDFPSHFDGGSWGDSLGGNDHFFGEGNRDTFADDFYARVEYLLWFSRSSNVPALVSTTTGNPAFSDAGVLGTTGTSVLFGDGGINNRYHSGVRSVMGLCLNPNLAIEFDYLYGGAATTRFDSTSSGNPILARPFFNVAANVNREDASVIAFSGGGANDDVSGRISILAESVFQTGGVFFRTPMLLDSNECPSELMVDFVTGYRFARLRESVWFETSQTAVEAPLVAPINTVTDVSEAFRNYNTFHGGDVGLIFQYPLKRAVLEVSTRVAFGGVRRVTWIQGETTVTEPGAAPVTTTGGLLTRPSNIGHYRDSAFAVLPEIGIRLNFQRQKYMSYSVGYNLVGLSSIYRAGETIDRSVNLPTPPDPVTGQLRPSFSPKAMGYWAQGVNLGLTFNY